MGGYALRNVHVRSYVEANKYLGNLSSKKLANNTNIFRSIDKETITVTLHGSVIVRYHQNGSIDFRNAGHVTRTTSMRIALLLPGDVSIFRKQGTMYANVGRDIAIEVEGWVRYKEGKLTNV